MDGGQPALVHQPADAPAVGPQVARGLGAGHQVGGRRGQVRAAGAGQLRERGRGPRRGRGPACRGRSRAPLQFGPYWYSPRAAPRARSERGAPRVLHARPPARGVPGVRRPALAGSARVVAPRRACSAGAFQLLILPLDLRLPLAGARMARSPDLQDIHAHYWSRAAGRGVAGSSSRGRRWPT